MSTLTEHSRDDSLSSAAAPQSNAFLPWQLILFIGSGCAALIYEVVWLQLLQLVIGLTTASLGILLGTYMGGMCLGSLLLPRLVSGRRHPLRVYAILELGIGACGLAVLYGLPTLADFYTAHWGYPHTSVAGAFAESVMLRGLIAAVCLLPPTLLMGATLPAISRGVESTPRGIAWLGFFYGGNIAGATLGCLLAGFYLLRVYNMAIATYVAVAINVAVAVLALVVSAFATHKAAAKPRQEVRPVGTSGAWAVYVAIALSGVSALGAEVVWTRLVSLMFGATVYTFSIILAVFLFGLGIGSSLGSIIARGVARPRLAFGICQMLLVFAAGWTITMITRSLPYWPVNAQLSSSPWYTFQLDLARSVWTILPPTILWGASFPLALAALAAKGADPGRLVGGTYAANTVGAIVGSLVFSLVLVPEIGTQWSHRVLVALPALGALLLLAPFALGTRASAAADEKPAGEGLRFATAIGILVMLGATGFLCWAVAPIPWGVVAYGRQMMASTWEADSTHVVLVPGVVDEKEIAAMDLLPNSARNNYCRYFGEGLNGSVCVSQVGPVRYFHSAGKVQASSDQADMRLQRLLGHISALLAKKNEDVLVIACGAGVTAGSFVPYQEVKHITICDIEPLVPDHVAKTFFDHENHGVIKDPRTTVVLDDGRHFIRTCKQKFDVITSDPIDPWVKGCAALNTVEYYEMCKAHLKPGGVMSLWIPLYESDSDTIKSVLATFFKVFPNGILWSNDVAGKGYDAVLFGQVEPSEIDVDALQARLDSPEYARVKQSLADVGFNDAIDLLSTYAGRAADLHKWMEDAQINNDADLRLQYLAGLAFNNHLEAKLLDDIRMYYKFPKQVFKGRAAARLKVALDGNAGVAKAP